MGLDENSDGKGGLPRGEGQGGNSGGFQRFSFIEVILHLRNNYLLMTILSEV